MRTEAQHNEPTYSPIHTLRLSTFQIGSAMGDILVTSIWNRILISSLGIAAAPVSLLIALRYLISPLSLWAGNLTDNRRLLGKRRAPVIWAGRALMVLSLPLLGLSVNSLQQSTTSPAGWGFALASSLMYGIGTLISGGPYLALVRDSAPEHKQGLAISTVETALIICFALSGIGFSLWMPAYEPIIFWEMIIATMVIGGFFWFFAIATSEKRNPPQMPAPAGLAWAIRPSRTSGLRPVLKSIWSDKRTRLFFAFLSLATFAAWMQDAILEPFGADAFNIAFERTTRFNAYWQTATVITLIAAGLAMRKRPPEDQKPLTSAGLLAMGAGMGLLALSGLMGEPRLIEVGLLVFGGGFGLFTFGGFSLMAVMSPTLHAGTYLGLWTISVLVSKGLGTFAGGALRDLLYLVAGLPAPTAYGLIFGVAALGLVTAVLILMRVDIVGFARDTGRTVDRREVQVAAAD